MKLLIAIVQDEDAGRVVSALMDKGFGVTKLATTGGFLRAGNTTLISGVEDEKLDEMLGVIEKICKSREQITASAAPMGSSAAGGVYVPYPMRVTVGGDFDAQSGGTVTINGGKLGVTGAFRVTEVVREMDENGRTTEVTMQRE